MTNSRPIHPDFQFFLDFKSQEVIALFTELRQYILEPTYLASLANYRIRKSKEELEKALKLHCLLQYFLPLQSIYTQGKVVLEFCRNAKH